MPARSIVVTGGASGIGAAVTRRFQDAGDKVTVLDLKQNETADANVTVDLTSRTSIEEAAAAITTPVDVLCNIAGLSGASPVPAVFGVNFLGLRHLSGLLMPQMSTGSAVVCVASTAGFYWRKHLSEVLALVDSESFDDGLAVGSSQCREGYEAYMRSKEAVIVWASRASQRYLGRVRVNTVSPGLVDTPLLPAFYASMGAAELDPLIELAGGRSGKPEEIAEAVYFLASPAASWVNGTDLVVDGGAEMASTLLHNSV